MILFDIMRFLSYADNTSIQYGAFYSGIHIFLQFKQESDSIKAGW
jgi:hypothetical protein